MTDGGEMDGMIEVRIDQTGDVGYAETPEAAVVCARTLLDDADVALPYVGKRPEATFLVDGQTVATGITKRELGHVLRSLT